MNEIQIIKSELIIEEIKEKSLESYENVSCWINKNNNHNIYVFLVEYDSESLLLEKWITLTGEIADNFQSSLEKDIEIWNVYILFVVENEVKEQNKYLIEQNKYSSRKIVFDNLSIGGDEQKKELIKSKLLNIEIVRRNIQSTTEVTTFIKLINDKNPKLSNLILDKFKEPINIYETYLEVITNERKN